jgi:signal transduction histidine kinase
MRFPPSIRITAPLLALAFGLSATWFDYRLNLDLDHARHLDEVRQSADAGGRRLARLAERLMASGERDALQADVEAMVELPQLEIAAVMDESGRLVAESTGGLRGQPATATRFARVARIIGAPASPEIHREEDASTVLSAHPFRVGESGIGWVLLEFNRTDAILAAQNDALTQLRWMASAMALLGFVLWSVLHFGFADRLARLTGSVRALGEGSIDASAVPRGGDEVGELGVAFTTMAAQLRERDAQQVRLEREVLEISERERRRIGHDLHDGLGQRLTAASMATNALIAGMKSEASTFTDRVEDIGRQLREAIAETRALSHGLAPVALADEGLMAALNSLAEDTRRGDLHVVFECPEPVRVSDAEIAGHLHRIAQEAVSNAIKHAAPTEIRIGLERRNGTVVLEVDDDGDGFDAALAARGGIGLRVMRYRAQLIGGVLEINSPPAGGTRISCSVPLPG